MVRISTRKDAVENKHPEFIAGIAGANAGAIAFRSRWSYTKAALQLLADCVKDAQAQQAQQAQPAQQAQAWPRVGRISASKLEL
jgi:hypothetical protein